MNIDFENPKLGEVCNSLRKATRRFGAKRAKLLFRKLGQLKSVQRLSDLGRLGKLKELRGDTQKSLRMKVDGGFRIMFRPTNDPLGLLPDGSLDWTKVTQIEITFVGDDHG